jgi:sucrose-6-phosphate hydrolase SacC (GH32 family)
MMKWQKQGLILIPHNANSWMKTHAQVPTPFAHKDFIRVYFSSRPERTLSLTTFIDLDAENPSKILYINENPILELGKPGTFDEHGIMPSSAVEHEGKVYLYYSGWSRSSSVPYTNSTGLAVSEDWGKTFTKISDGPILGKSLHDPYSATSPCVLKDKNGWYMWYCSGTDWIQIRDKYEHTYDIKYAHSRDGILWQTSGEIIIKAKVEGEAITRPYVMQDTAGYHMWFCYRGSQDFRDGTDAYRIGYAYSNDLRSWQRDDAKAGITLSKDGRMYMFYNGNSFGREGFGYAILEK